jgi:drug/metabolite transporter (DMT)-like permease
VATSVAFWFVKGDIMNAIKITTTLLFVVGVLWLMFGGFKYNRKTHRVALKPIKLSVMDWANVGIIVIGCMFVFYESKKS